MRGQSAGAGLAAFVLAFPLCIKGNMDLGTAFLVALLIALMVAWATKLTHG
jgi:hypothetical protein